MREGRFKMGGVYYGLQMLYECRYRGEDAIEAFRQLFCRGHVAAGPVFNTITTV